jgi:hypothetical protein
MDGFFMGDGGREAVLPLVLVGSFQHLDGGVCCLAERLEVRRLVHRDEEVTEFTGRVEFAVREEQE